MSVIRTVMLSLALLAGFSAFPEVAHARRGFAIINTGEDIFESGPVPETLFTSLPAEDQAAARTQMAGWNAGYRCNILGVFWVYFLMWDCKPVAFKDDTYDDQQEVAAAVEATYRGKYSPGFWKGTMRWVLAGLAALAGLAIVGEMIFGKKGNTGDGDGTPDAPPPAAS